MVLANDDGKAYGNGKPSSLLDKLLFDLFIALQTAVLVNVTQSSSELKLSVTRVGTTPLSTTSTDEKCWLNKLV